MSREIILCHFGGPTSAEQVEPFLFELFSDPAILRLPRFIRWLRPWLARWISSRRAPRVVKEYKNIGFSPINRYTDAQRENLQKLVGDSARVYVINRYTAPRAKDILKTLSPECEKRWFLALYPHFSTTSTGSSFDEIRTLDSEVPGTCIQKWWHNERFNTLITGFIVEKIDEVKKNIGIAPITVLFSAHGIPEPFVAAGDPYKNQIEAHAKYLEACVRQKMPADVLSDVYWTTSFQSRVGPVEWIKPYTDKVIPILGQERGGGLIIVPISFISDHLETLFEIETTYRNLALENGFRHCTRTRLPNDDPEMAECLLDILKNHGF